MPDYYCPYCDKPQEYNGEGFEQDETWDEECSECGKSFILTVWYDPEFKA